MIFGERLKKLREKRYSQEQLADLLHVHNNTISKWENGNQEPRTKRVTQLAQILGTTAAYLLGETDDPAQDSIALAKKIGNEEVDLKKPIAVGMSEHNITITDNNTKFTYSFPNNEEGRKSLELFLNYSLKTNTATVSNAITGDNNNGNKLGIINN